jgi:hypothetical protein
MGKAKMHEGQAIVAYRDGKAIDADGNVIKGAPKPTKDTDPSQQLGRANADSPEKALALEIARAALNPAAYVAAAQAAEAANAAAVATDDDEGEDTEESEDLPALAEMPEYLATMSDVDELRALKRQDKRKGGKALIQARIDALKAGE